MYFYAAPISHFLRGKNPIKTTDFTALHPRQVSKIRFHFPFISWLNYNTGKKRGLFLVLVEPRPSFRSLIGHFVLRLCTRPRKQSDHWLMKYFFFLTHKHTHLITLNSQIQLFEQIEKFYTLVIKTVTGIMACTLTEFTIIWLHTPAASHILDPHKQTVNVLVCQPVFASILWLPSAQQATHQYATTA